MKFSCEKCSARYSIPDAKVQGKVLKVRCKKCSHVIVVRAKQTGASSKPAASETQRIQWYVAIKGKQHGPMTQDGVLALFNKGRIRDRSFIWHKGLSSWTRLMELEEFKTALYPKTSVSPQPSPPPGTSIPDAASLHNKNIVSAAVNKSEPPSGTAFSSLETTDQQVRPDLASVAQKLLEHPEDSVGDSFQNDSFGAADTLIDTSSPFQKSAAKKAEQPQKSEADLAAAFDDVMGANDLPQTTQPVDPNDPFANVANIAPGDVEGFAGVAENTRIFMMRAGLHNRKKKQMNYAITGFVFLAAFSTALALDYYRVIEIPFMHSVTNFVVTSTNIPAPKRKWATADDLEEGDQNLKCKMMGNCPKKKPKRKRSKKRPSGINKLNLDDAFQQTGKSENGLKRSGIGKNGMADIGAMGGAGRTQEFAQLLGKGGPSRARPVGKIDAPEEKSGSTLDPKNVSTVARAGQAGIKQCLESAMKRKEKVKGEKKKRLILTINPNGRVGKAVFTDPILNAQPLGECILQRAKRWKFAPFTGEPTEVVLPVILTTSL